MARGRMIGRSGDRSDPVGCVDNLSIAVVIPALNEERCIGATISRCMNDSGTLEVIVADGGSTDRTLEVAEAAGAATVVSESGRARQMNSGAAMTRGDVLLFLHADTWPPKGFVESIRYALSDPAVVGGAFSMEVDDQDRLMRAVSALSTLRSRLLRLPYGDQGIFVRRSSFERIGGYADIPILEDAELCGRLKGLGRLEILRSHVRTSARRWKAEGPLKVIVRNWAIGLAYACGVSPRTLVRYYGPPVR
jgi:rSAM/selenodomain-associated transferase 2